MGKRLYHLENLVLAYIKQNQPEEILPMTKYCNDCRYFHNVKCHLSNIGLNQDKMVDKCHYA